MNIYVGNLSYAITNEELENLFQEFGAVAKAHIIFDRDTNRSKGFGFVEMDIDDEAQKAIEELDGASVDGRNIKVNQALPREDKPRSVPAGKRW